MWIKTSKVKQEQNIYGKQKNWKEEIDKGNKKRFMNSWVLIWLFHSLKFILFLFKLGDFLLNFGKNGYLAHLDVIMAFDSISYHFILRTFELTGETKSLESMINKEKSEIAGL